MKKNQRITLQVEAPHITVCGISDPGRLRPENEDTIFLDKKGNFMLLADGMGGHERGGEASAGAIEIIQEFLQPEILLSELADITEAEGIPAELICLTSLVDDAVQKANSVIYERNQKAGYHRYMGTTIVGLIPVKQDYMLWFHVGDSRLYCWRDSALKQLTVDHSARLEWERNGRFGTKPAKNIITRAIGPEAITSADIGYDNRLKDDIYLMCSDGLTDMLPIEAISKILNSEGSPTEIANQLVDAANDAGGKDNVSVVLCRMKS
jgi:protein phosphatase